MDKDPLDYLTALAVDTLLLVKCHGLLPGICGEEASYDRSHGTIPGGPRSSESVAGNGLCCLVRIPRFSSSAPYR